MKPFYIKDLRTDETRKIEDRYLVKNADIRDGNNGKKHLYMTLADATGEIQTIKWSLTRDEMMSYSKIKAGMVISVSKRNPLRRLGSHRGMLRTKWTASSFRASTAS